MGPKRSSSYLPLPSQGTTVVECFCGSTIAIANEDGTSPTRNALGLSSLNRLSRIVLILLCFLVIFTLGAAVAILLYRPTDQYCARQLSVWSPVLDAVEYTSQDFDNSFAHKTEYRGPPTDEVEAAWLRLTNKHEIIIPESRLAALNRSLKTYPAKVQTASGTGYRANVEVFHQLHCLNLVRQYTWLQAGKYHDKPPSTFASGSDVAKRMHADHCIEAIRLALMCNADVTPLVSISDGTDRQGFRADFNAYHKCRDFGKIEAWMNENDVIIS
ncbi:hypothetical protein F5Y16DRAFT_384195 [Xylariaceae sp. FL0255]|nr:hypothetical protein F5Y16DRAFT_384195 [Xylariaceae sp. FL0255]